MENEYDQTVEGENENFSDDEIVETNSETQDLENTSDNSDNVHNEENEKENEKENEENEEEYSGNDNENGNENEENEKENKENENDNENGNENEEKIDLPDQVVGTDEDYLSQQSVIELSGQLITLLKYNAKNAVKDPKKYNEEVIKPTVDIYYQVAKENLGNQSHTAFNKVKEYLPERVERWILMVTDGVQSVHQTGIQGEGKNGTKAYVNNLVTAVSSVFFSTFSDVKNKIPTSYFGGKKTEE